MGREYGLLSGDPVELHYQLSVEDLEKVSSDNSGVSYYTFPDGTEVRQISAHLASFPAQIVQYAARSGRMDGNCKSEDLADRIRDFKKVRDFATWEIERLEAL